MPLLEAFLALALTLLSLATIATLVVELIHRLAGTRAKNLKMMLEKYYDEELKTIVQTELKKSGEALDEHRAAFIEALITNPMVKKGQKVAPLRSRLRKFAGLSTEDLFKKLVHTDIGRHLKAKTETQIDEAVDALSQSYDAFGVAATDLFKRKAQVTSLWVGVLVAFVLNANALSIFRSYLDDPQARAKAVAKADAVLESFSQRADAPEAFESKEAMDEHIESIRTAIERLEAGGVTLGYSRDRIPASWFQKNPAPGFWPGILFWLSGVSATGLLIGLGGPFWFNVVRKLTDVLQTARGGAPTVTEPQDSAGASTSSKKSYRDVFKMTGGAPPSVKVQAALTRATQFVTDADKAVIVAADALIAIRKAAGDNPEESMMIAIADAEAALKMATDAQKRAYEGKKAAEQAKADADTRNPEPVHPEGA